jgi:hypothetical protein
MNGVQVFIRDQARSRIAQVLEEMRGLINDKNDIDQNNNGNDRDSVAYAALQWQQSYARVKAKLQNAQRELVDIEQQSEGMSEGHSWRPKLPNNLPEFTNKVTNTKRNVQDFLTVFESSLKGAGYPEVWQNTHLWSLSLLTLPKLSVMDLGFINNKIVDAGVDWATAKRIFTAEFTNLKDPMGPCREFCNTVQDNDSVAIHAQRFKEKFTDTLLEPGQLKGWEMMPVFTYMFLQSLKPELVQLATRDARLIDQIEKGGLDGVISLLITIEGQVRASDSFTTMFSAPQNDSDNDEGADESGGADSDHDEEDTTDNDDMSVKDDDVDHITIGDDTV